MYRNNFILTFSNFGEKENIGIYKKKNSRELIPVEDILLINDKTKLISRTILEWMIINKIASVYDYEKNEGIFNHMVIRNNEKDEYMIEFYLYKFDEVLVNRLNNYNWDFHNIKTVYYQIQNSNKNNFRGDYTLLYGNKYLFGIPLISLGTSIFKYGNVKKSQSFIVSLLIILTICLVYFNGILSPLPNHPVFNNQILHLCSVIFFNNNFPYISGCHIINGSAKQVLYVFVGLSIFFSVPGILQVYPSKK